MNRLQDIRDQIAGLLFFATEKAEQYHAGGDDLLAMAYGHKADAFQTCLRVVDHAIALEQDTAQVKRGDNED